MSTFTELKSQVEQNDFLPGDGPGKTVEAKNDPLPLASFDTDPSDDPTELLCHRFLCRGGGALLVGPTGIGKSSFALQAAMTWAVGLPHFGIRPRGELRSLIVQAENDDGDLVEMRDGVIEGMVASKIMTEAQAEEAAGRVYVVRDCTHAGYDFGLEIQRYLGRCEEPIDLVFIDPAFAYVEGEANSSRDVGDFLRRVINPIAIRHKVGVIIAHHTNKPSRGEEKGQWQAGDFAYLGAGSAEWCNWARAVLAIRSIGSYSVFQLMAAKRGKRLGWTDDEGGKIVTRFIGHSEHGICWRPVPLAEVRAAREQAAGAAKEHYSESLTAALEIVMRQVWTVAEYKAALVSELGLKSDATLKGLIDLVASQKSIGRERVQDGCTPFHYIGPRDAVRKQASEHREAVEMRKVKGKK